MSNKFTGKLLGFLLLLFCSYGAKAQISGTVSNDLNGLTDNTVNGIGSNAGGLNAVLVNTATGNVTATAAVAANGTYSFAAPVSAAYNVLITTATATVGNPAPAVTLPANWVSTGEYLGTGTGSDGTINGILPLGTTTSATNANFGIEQLPSTNTSTAAAIANPGEPQQPLLQPRAWGGPIPMAALSILSGFYPSRPIPQHWYWAQIATPLQPSRPEE